MKKKIILNDHQLETTLLRLACQLTENHDDFKETILVGLQPRGKFLCEKLVNILIDKYPVEVFEDKENIGENQKSVTFEMVFQDSKKTLEDKDVNPIIDEIIDIADKKFNAKLRV